MEFIQILLLVTILVVLVNKKQNSDKKLPLLKGGSKKVVIDSCGLIDGRITNLVESGFISDTLVVPEIVLKELQQLADGRDSHKRERARYGLDVAKILQDNKNTEFEIDRTVKSPSEKTDDILVQICKKSGDKLYTTDFNLTKLAEIEGVTVLNVNELAQQLRSIALPGEKIQVKIMQKGSNPRQGVGYLDDGTMVVIDDAAKLKGRIVKGEVVKVHQTVAGKMIFAIKSN
jgi:uncharacterized protein YacL